MHDQLGTINNIFLHHGEKTIYITSTGFISRIAYNINKKCNFKYKIFYMQGSMGLAPSIGYGIAISNRNINVVVINGDGAYLMHMGFSTVIINNKLDNFTHYVLNNNSYESVGKQQLPYDINNLSLKDVDIVFHVKPLSTKPDRVDVTPAQNTNNIMDAINEFTST